MGSDEATQLLIAKELHQMYIGIAQNHIFKFRIDAEENSGKTKICKHIGIYTTHNLHVQYATSSCR